MHSPIDIIKRYLPVTKDTEAALRALMIEKVFRRGELIEQRAELQNNVYFLAEGLAREFFYRNGAQHTLSFVSDGEFIVLSQQGEGDILSSIEFLERSTVILIPRNELVSRFGPDDPSELPSSEALSYMVTAMLRHIRDVEERSLVLQTYSARQRYQWMAQRYPRILERASTTQIASFLGLTKETLYRIRSNKYITK